MIQSRLNILIAEKELREARKWPYRAISEETGISKTTLVRLARPHPEGIQTVTLDALCRFFGVGVGAVLEYISEDRNGETA